jgi:signal peptide peptidase SppA
MSHALQRLAASIHNRPHLVTASSLELVLDYLDKRNFGEIVLMPDGEDYKEDDEDELMVKDGLGVLSVTGTLTYRPVMTMCGEVGTSYTRLVSDMEELANAGARTVVMQVDSGGGEAAHCFEAARHIRDIADNHSITMIGYADTCACSAAYGLLSVCDYVVANPSSDVGSIGVLVALMDTSKAYEKAGVKRVFITAGGSKVPFADDGGFRQEFLEEIQERVNTLWGEFAEHVSTYRGLSVEDIKALDAKVFTASKAKSNGLVDEVMTNNEFAAFVAKVHKDTLYEG